MISLLLACGVDAPVGVTGLVDPNPWGEHKKTGLGWMTDKTVARLCASERVYLGQVTDLRVLEVPRRTSLPFGNKVYTDVVLAPLRVLRGDFEGSSPTLRLQGAKGRVLIAGQDGRYPTAEIGSRLLLGERHNEHDGWHVMGHLTVLPEFDAADVERLPRAFASFVEAHCPG